jgi:ATP-dependent Clp protease ATP-binding subunit ClpC
MLKDVIDRALEKDIQLEVTERFKDRLVEDGFNPSFGARPLRRAIIRLVEDSIAEKILAGEVEEGDSIILDVDEKGRIKITNSEKSFTSKISNTYMGIS